jgi:hypothetical protein
MEKYQGVLMTFKRLFSTLKFRKFAIQILSIHLYFSGKMDSVFFIPGAINFIPEENPVLNFSG